MCDDFDGACGLFVCGSPLSDGAEVCVDAVEGDDVISVCRCILDGLPLDIGSHDVAHGGVVFLSDCVEFIPFGIAESYAEHV